MNSSRQAISVENLHKSFGANEVLKGVDLTATGGEVISVLGSSGSGKSTLLRCINLLEIPNSGTIRVAGEEVLMKKNRRGENQPADKRQVERIRSKLAMVFQQFNLWSHMTILENVMEAPVHVLKQAKKVARDRAIHYLEKVGIGDKLDAYPVHLSGGQQQRAAIEHRAESVRGELERHRISSQALQVQRETIYRQLNANGHDIEQVLETMPEGATEDEWQRSLERVATRIARLGPINLAAIDEYNLQSERKNYLDLQNEDLETALETLQSAIRKIDKETRNRFRDTFDKVNNGLQDLFPRVFGGGSAYLEMTGDDLLDTGISIMARPPGKKNSTIHLLSGGEKALTAIALVFSIFQLNPAPFCMLDEVDAPLDDANVGRYARMVKEMSEKVQFIYITHNKISMELADQLMGVTMHEPGVSRLVSVDVEEAAELAAS